MRRKKENVSAAVYDKKTPGYSKPVDPSHAWPIYPVKS